MFPFNNIGADGPELIWHFLQFLISVDIYTIRDQCYITLKANSNDFIWSFEKLV